jgi:hypothetical protein
MVDVEKDFKEFLHTLNCHDVKYCIIGAFAVALHAIPRYTKDLDIWVEASRENGERVLRALRDFGFGSLEISADDFAYPGGIVQLGYEPVRIDLITDIPGCTFAEAWENKVCDSFGGEPVYFVGLDDLIASKEASGRPQDLADLDTLRRHRDLSRS